MRVGVQIKDKGCTVDVPDIVAGVVKCQACAPKLGSCFTGDNKKIKACCDKGYRCMKRTARSGRCVSPTFSSRSWDGTILICSA